MQSLKKENRFYMVEFIQSFCWLYSMPNLLIIQHLETLYLGGNHVRVVCERVCTQEGSRDWISRLASRQRWHTCEACREAEESCQLLHYKTKLLVWPDSQLTTQTCDLFQSRGRVARTPCLLETRLFAFHTHPSINTLIPIKCRELLERILKEKP